MFDSLNPEARPSELDDSWTARVIQVLKNIPDALEIVSGDVIPYIRIRCNQTGAGFTDNNFKWANEGVDVFSR